MPETVLLPRRPRGNTLCFSRPVSIAGFAAVAVFIGIIVFLSVKNGSKAHS